MKKRFRLTAWAFVTMLLLAACIPAAAPNAPTSEPAAAPTEAPAQEAAPAEASSGVVFFSTQFSPVEEQEKFRAILKEGGFNFTASDEGPLLDLLKAESETGKGTIDVIGVLHGTYPPLERTDSLVNMIDIADDLGKDREFDKAFLKTGLLGSADYLYYVPWMQATYIMAANKKALPYLPEGADVNTLTWEQLGAWCKAIVDQTGDLRCGLPHKGLFHRFLEGYLFPSFTGGMVTSFKSDDAVKMLEWAKADLWPYVNPQSISYEFMQEPLQSGEVWVAFDHTARLITALNDKPEDFVTFPAPIGPKGRGFMPVIVGLGIPKTAPNPEGAAKLINYLTTPAVQAKVLQQMGFYPVVANVDTSNLPGGIALEAAAVSAQSASPDSIPSLLPVGLGDRGGELNQIFRNAFDRTVINGEDIRTVLDEEGANLQKLMDETGAPCWAPDPVSDGPCQVK